MRRSLPLPLDGRICWFPLADRSALALERVWLGAPDPAEALIDCLQVDPPLLLWAVWCRWRDARQWGPTARETADWLQGHLPELLGQPVACESREDGAAIAAQVEQDLLLAEVAHALAAEQDPAQAEAARFLGLVRHGPQWLALLGCSGGSPLPWQELLESHPGAAPVASAVERLSAAEAQDRLVLEARHRAKALREQWLAAVPYPPELLTRWAVKLARLAQLEQRFEETLEREKLTAMAEFAAGAGHEINNPLTVIAGRAQLFLREEKDPERRRELALINAQAMRVYEMIADMRLFARPPAPERKPCDLVELVDRALSELAARAAEQETSLGRRTIEGPVLLWADPTQMLVAIKALCVNALEALRPGGQVEVELGCQGDWATLCVSDNGPGFGPEERRRLFDPFFSARQAGRGLGMGLCKCWRIVTAHGGRIDVQGEPAHGASFTIRLPCGKPLD